MIVRQLDPLREFDQMLRSYGFGWETPGGVGLGQLPVDVVRRQNELVLTLDVPGVSPEDLDVTVERNVLTVTAERPSPNVEGDTVVARERRWGKVTRQFTLSDGLDTSALEASLDAGVLTIRIPVAEKAKPQKVAIAVGSSPQAIEATSNGA